MERKTSGLELSWEAADGITTSNLIKSYDIICDEIAEIKQEIADGKPVDWRLEDLAYHEAMAIHFQKVLSYFGETV